MARCRPPLKKVRRLRGCPNRRAMLKSKNANCRISLKVPAGRSTARGFFIRFLGKTHICDRLRGKIIPGRRLSFETSNRTSTMHVADHERLSRLLDEHSAALVLYAQQW